MEKEAEGGEERKAEPEQEPPPSKLLKVIISGRGPPLPTAVPAVIPAAAVPVVDVKSLPECIVELPKFSTEDLLGILPLTSVTSPSASLSASAYPNMLAVLMGKTKSNGSNGNSKSSSPISTSTQSVTSSITLDVPGSSTATTQAADTVTTPALGSSPMCNPLVTPGVKDSDGFLTPPPASTLLLRRTRLNSSGPSTYVIASTPIPGTSTSATTAAGSSESSSRIEGRTRNRSTSGRSIKRPKFDDERVVYTPSDIGKKKESSPSVSSAEYFKNTDNEPTALYDEVVVLEPTTSTALQKSKDSSYGGGAHGVGKTMPATKSKAKASKGKPLSFMAMTESAAGIGMKKQRKERAPDKNKNVDPRTGKRRYIKKKGFRLLDRPMGRSISFCSELGGGGGGGDLTITWRPADDLRLIINAKQTCDLRLVQAGTNFSCDYSLEHVETRWKSLLYNKSVSKVSQLAINNLHSKVKADILGSALYSKEEDDLIKTVGTTTEKPEALLLLNNLLNAHPLTFVKFRTLRHLYQHWKELKEFHLLHDQDVTKYFARESFIDVEEALADSSLQTDTLDDAVYQELLIENKHMRKKIRVAEEEITPWKIMTNLAIQFEPKASEEAAFAFIRGQFSRFVMRSREIIVGRQTTKNHVDVDLAMEGTTYKISRRQAVIQLRDSGDFVFYNLGKHSVVLDGETLLPQHTGHIRDQTIIEISSVKLVFAVNHKMVLDLRSKLVEREKKREQNGLSNYVRPPPVKSEKRSSKNTNIPPVSNVLSDLLSSNSRQPQGVYNSNLMSIFSSPNYNPNPGPMGKVVNKGSLPSIPYNPRPITAATTAKPKVPLTRPQIFGIPNATAVGIGFKSAGISSGPSLPSPAIFRRATTSQGVNVIVQQSVNNPTTPGQVSVVTVSQSQQSSSYQIGDLTIRPGVPPMPQTQ